MCIYVCILKGLGVYICVYIEGSGCVYMCVY